MSERDWSTCDKKWAPFLFLYLTSFAVHGPISLPRGTSPLGFCE